MSAATLRFVLLLIVGASCLTALVSCDTTVVHYTTRQPSEQSTQQARHGDNIQTGMEANLPLKENKQAEAIRYEKSSMRVTRLQNIMDTLSPEDKEQLQKNMAVILEHPTVKKQFLKVAPRRREENNETIGTEDEIKAKNILKTIPLETMKAMVRIMVRARRGSMSKEEKQKLNETMKEFSALWKLLTPTQIDALRYVRKQARKKERNSKLRKSL